MDASRPHVGRRSVLQALALGASVAAVGPGLTACGGGSTPAPTVPGKAAALPTFAPAGRIKPDLVGNAQGLQDGYLSGIADRFASVEGKPGTGKPVTAFLITYLPPPPPVSENTWWKATNERVGADIKIEVTPASDFAAKFGSVMAGNDVADFVQIPIYLNLPRLPELYRNRFTDLTDHLSGDNVKKYPNLAGIPTYAWTNSLVGGRIYSVPVSSAVFSGPLFMRGDILAQLGITKQPGNAAEFETMCAEVTDPKAGRWALGAPANFNIDIFMMMFGAPRTWRLETSGKLTRVWETEELREAVTFARNLREKGYYHPEGGAVNSTQVKEQFGGGKVVMCVDALGAWVSFYESYSPATPNIKVDAMLPFTHDGTGTPIFHFDQGTFSLTALKKSEPARIEELLRIMNFFAAPYGSQEQLLNTFGVEGVNHTRQPDNNVVVTERGKLERGTNFTYIANGAPVMFNAQFPNQVRQQYEWEKVVTPLGIRDPTLGLYSDTGARVQAQIDRAFREAMSGIIAGRAPLSAFDAAIQAWRTGGGDAIRQELQDALAAK